MLSAFVVGSLFLLALLGALAFLAYVAWRGSQPSDFFTEAIKTDYDLELPKTEIDAFYFLRDRLQKQFAPETIKDEPEENGDSDEEDEPDAGPPWTHKVPPDHRQVLQQALMRRLVACIGKLDQVQKDRPGNWKLWQTKLVSERYWNTLCDAEKIVSQEIDACITDAEEIEPGWREHVFQQAVQLYRMQKSREDETVEQKKAVLNEKKEKEKEVKRKEVELRMAVEEKLKRERLAVKAMEDLIKQEEKTSKEKKAAKGKATAAGSKPRSRKK